MLGYVTAEGRGEADQLIRNVAMRLLKEGVCVAGAVQINIETDPNRKCEMELQILTGDGAVRISQDLGTLSDGCRLDPDGLERAVGLAAAGLDRGVEMVIINKFGKQEIEGRGFRPLIGDALSAGIPVLTAVGKGHLNGFLDYAQGFAEPVPCDAEAVYAWAQAMLNTPTTAEKQ